MLAYDLQIFDRFSDNEILYQAINNLKETNSNIDCTSLWYECASIALALVFKEDASKFYTCFNFIDSHIYCYKILEITSYEEKRNSFYELTGFNIEMW